MLFYFVFLVFFLLLFSFLFFDDETAFLEEVVSGANSSSVNVYGSVFDNT